MTVNELLIPGTREAALEAAALDFVAKVDRGEARSKKSYAAFKDALAIGSCVRNDLGIVLSALRYLEESTGERFDDEGGIIEQIERDYSAITQCAWQPIETAPFKRTVFLSRIGEGLCVTAYRFGPIAGWRHAHSSDKICFEPTHWMDLPKPLEEPK